MQRSELINWHVYNSLDFIEQQWIIDQLIPVESTICLYGARGLGKTFLTLDFALSIATGTSWNGLNVKKGKVAYMLAERTEGLTRRISGWATHKNFLKEDLLQIIGNKEQSFKASSNIFSINELKDRKKLIAALKDQEIKLLVLDPMISYANGKENDSRDMQEIVLGAREITNEIGCSVLLVHHAGKQTDGFNKGARGSSALEAGMDTVIELSKQKNSNYEILSVTKQREHEAISPMVLEFLSVEDELQRPLGKFPIHVIGVAPQETIPNTKNKKRENLKTLLLGLSSLSQKKSEGCTTKEIADAIGKPKETIHHQLQSYLKEKYLDKKQNGRNQLYSLTDKAEDFLKSLEEDKNNE